MHVTIRGLYKLLELSLILINLYFYNPNECCMYNQIFIAHKPTTSTKLDILFSPSFYCDLLIGNGFFFLLLFLFFFILFLFFIFLLPKSFVLNFHLTTRNHRYETGFFCHKNEKTVKPMGIYCITWTLNKG